MRSTRRGCAGHPPAGRGWSRDARSAAWWSVPRSGPPACTGSPRRRPIPPARSRRAARRPAGPPTGPPSWGSPRHRWPPRTRAAGPTRSPAPPPDTPPGPRIPPRPRRSRPSTRPPGRDRARRPPRGSPGRGGHAARPGRPGSAQAGAPGTGPGRRGRPSSRRGSPEPGPDEAARVAQAVAEQRRLLRVPHGSLPEGAGHLLDPEALLDRGHRHLAGVELALSELELLERLGGERAEPARRVGDPAPGDQRGQPGEDLHAVGPAEQRPLVPAALQHPRAVHDVRVAVQDRLDQLGELERVVLSV